MNIGAQFDQLSTSVGDLWFVAFVGSCFVMICEAARPKPAFGELAEGVRGFGLLIMVLSLLTPLLLLMHAFVTANGALAAITALIAGAIVGAAIIGWIIGAAAPSIGERLYRASPFLAAPVFALTVFVTWRSAFDLLA